MPIDGPDCLALMTARRDYLINIGEYTPASPASLRSISSISSHAASSITSTPPSSPPNPTTKLPTRRIPHRTTASSLSSGWAPTSITRKTAFAVPYWMEREGLQVDIPAWMLNREGSSTIDFVRFLRADEKVMEMCREMGRGKRESCKVFAKTGRCKFGMGCE